MNQNTSEVAKLQPDYLGFIFYQGSPRFFDGQIPELPANVKRVGVFVNADIEDVLQKSKAYQLDVIQLHGDESPEYCDLLLSAMARSNSEKSLIPLWKVFGVDQSFDFDVLYPYEDLVDAYLFDTKSVQRGGTGTSFDWEVLKKYPFKKPFVLSGGIGIESQDAIRSVQEWGLPLLAIDMNSRFEIEPGLKNIPLLKRFMDQTEVSSE